MTNSIDRSSFFWTYLSPSLFGVARAAVATPIDVVATTEILDRKTTRQVLKETPLNQYGKGFQPNAVKFIIRTPAQFLITNFFSTVIPTNLNPAVRGFTMGLFISGAEASVSNIFNSARTRFIEGAGWKDLGREGPAFILKGLTAAWSHRGLSSAIFYAGYEPLKKEYPSHGMAVSTVAGVGQVILTSPFYIAMIERQRKNAIPESLVQTLLRLYKSSGVFRGLVVPALIPRLIHTIVITGPLMKLMDEKLGLIHR